MIDLRNIAQQLRLPADQLRIAADLLEQGYQPAFIARYRADEAGNFPGSVLWSLKFAIEREHQLSTARKEAMAHLGDGVELDEEGRERIERARTIVDIDVALRCFRARRAARQSGERSGQASQLLEKLIAATAPVSDMPAWIAEQLAVDASQSDAILQQCSRLVGTLLSGETRLMERMRQTIQKRANVRVEAQSETPAKAGKGDKDKGEAAGGPDGGQNASARGDGPAGAEAPADQLDSDAAAEAWGHHEDDLVGDHAEGNHAHAEGNYAEGNHAEEQEEVSEGNAPQLSDATTTGQAGASETAAADTTTSPSADASATATSATATSATATSATATSATATSTTETSATGAAGSEAAAAGAEAPSSTDGEPPISLTFDSGGKKSRENKLSGGKRKEKTAATTKSLAKLTPRQRRRRWLASVLQPFKSLKKPLSRLTSYQMLMLGRGQRSQLIKVELEYDRRALVNMARDVFVSDSHPLAKWFTEACEVALGSGLLAKVETDALAEEDELAQQKLLEAAADQLRVSLLQRPVKGHRILVVDTVGPNSSCIAVIDARGKCLATQEVVCSSQPSVVSQNVIMLGELVHKHKVTLVALSNGPARRFLVHTVAELMKQSANGNLRWTMVDRGGAEAYATSRHASVELPQLNRRFRAAVWLGRRLQDPLSELLKLDPSRLRLGSYQRELPQEPLKRLVTSTLSDCVCVKGVDARYASEQQFSYVPGVSPEVAQRLSDLAAKREFTSRQDLTTQVENWSETGQRQALGFLRIYNSAETLDGTLIHPDDYRLAHRLIENTDLAQPPAAPEGWQPPKIKQPKPPRGSAATGTATPSGLDAADASPESAGASSTELSASLEAAAAVGAEQTAGSPEAVVSAEAAASPETAAPETASPESAGADSAGPESAGPEAASAEASVQAGDANQPEVDTAGADSSQTADGGEADQASAEEMSTTESAVEVTPEYSEDVVAQQASAPEIDVEKLARSWQVGRSKLAWLGECLANPFGDTRDRRPPLPMLDAVPTLADLKPGMSVYAIVVGVAEFGAFVELGPDCGGLIHISRLSARYVEDPHQAVQIGDLIQAWVVSVDVDKKRVALTALSPEQQEQQAEAQRSQEHSRGDFRGHRGAPQGGGQQSGGAQRSGGQQPQRSGRPGAGQGGGGGGRPGGAGGGQRRERGGAPAGRGRGGERGGRHEGTSRPVVVRSKKPAKPITEAMQKGQEPLRSFSDLMQFYELQRPDAPTAVAPAPPAPVATEPAPAPQPEAATEPQAKATGE